MWHYQKDFNQNSIQRHNVSAIKPSSGVVIQKTDMGAYIHIDGGKVQRLGHRLTRGVIG